MNIGFVSTRLAGTDRVSLETAKLAAVLRQTGHQIFYCAGELDDNVAGLLALVCLRPNCILPIPSPGN